MNIRELLKLVDAPLRAWNDSIARHQRFIEQHVAERADFITWQEQQHRQVKPAQAEQLLAGEQLENMELRQRIEQAEQRASELEASVRELLNAYWNCGRVWSREAFDAEPVVRQAHAALARTEPKEGKNG